MISFDPVGHRLMIDCKDAPDAALIGAFQIEAHGLVAHRFWVAVEVRLWRIVAIALAALEALTASAVQSGFDLSSSRLAIGTLLHLLTLAHLLWFSHSRKSKILYY